RLKGALPRTGRSAPVDPAAAADAFLKFVSDCRYFEATDRLDQQARPGGDDEREARARALYAAAAAENRQEVVSAISRIEDVGECDRGAGGAVWGVVGVLADTILSKPRRTPGKSRSDYSMALLGIYQNMTCVAGGLQEPLGSAVAVPQPPVRLVLDR